MECFFPTIKSCGSAVGAGQAFRAFPLSGRPPRPTNNYAVKDREGSSNSDKVKSKQNVRNRSSTSSKSSSSSKKKKENESRRSSNKKSSNSWSKALTALTDDMTQAPYTEKPTTDSSSKHTFTKRIGAAYIRTDESIMTNDNTNDGLELLAHGSIEGTVTASTSSSESVSLNDEEACTGSLAGTTLQDGVITRDSFMAENASVTTDNVATKSGPFSWFQPTLNEKFNFNHQTSTQKDKRSSNSFVGSDSDAPPSSPASSVVGIKKTIKSKFDYIRKAKQFSNFVDPPSDQSFRTSCTSVSVKADVSINDGRPMDSRMTRRSELAKQIIQRRSMNTGASSGHTGSQIDP